MIGVKIGRGAGRGGSAPWGTLGAWVGWCPPCTHHPIECPMGWAWSCQGIPSQSQGCWSRASPTALPALGTRAEQQVGAPGLALPAADFQGQESHQKKLKSSNSDSQGWLSLRAGKGGAQAGMGMSSEHHWCPPESLSCDCTKVPPPLPSLSLFQLS